MKLRRTNGYVLTLSPGELEFIINCVQLASIPIDEDCFEDQMWIDALDMCRELRSLLENSK